MHKASRQSGPNIRRLFAAERELVNTVIDSKIGESEQRIRTIGMNSLTPFQRWCISGGVERAYTGNIWYERDVGTYHCVGCDKELFRYF